MIDFLKKYNYKVQILTVLIIFIPFFSKSQHTTADINPDKIHQKHKYKFIHNKYFKKSTVLNDLMPKCYDLSDTESYLTENDTFIVKENINTVWEKYKTISLKDIYCGKIVHFGFIYSKKKNKFIYENDDFDGMHEGQVYFIRLNLLGGIKKLIVAYEITKIDEEKKMIQFCYINNGISEGSQKIFLSKTKDGFTKILHKTLYKSKSKFRDHFLYPVFHRKVVAELHNNLIRSLSKNTLSKN